MCVIKRTYYILVFAENQINAITKKDQKLLNNEHGYIYEIMEYHFFLFFSIVDQFYLNYVLRMTNNSLITDNK